MARHTHPRDNSLHVGVEYDWAVTIANSIGPFPAGTDLRTILIALYDASLVQHRLRVDATVLRTGLGSVTLRSFIPGHLSFDAFLSRHFQISAFVADGKKPTFQGGAFQNNAYQVSPVFNIFAAIFRQQAGSYTVDAVQRLLAAGSLNTDATVFRTQSGSLTVAAAQQMVTAATLMLDAAIINATTFQLTFDAVTLTTQSSTVDVDAVIVPLMDTFDFDSFQSDAFE